MATDEEINILLVDDSPTNLLALESILYSPEINIVSVSSGEDALRYLLHNEVALILLDVYMPGIDGLETAKLIRGREKSRDIPIIFLTADSTGGRHLSRGYSLGAVDYIVKPIEPDILRCKVNVFVELFKKRLEIKHQARLLAEKNLQLENANLARLKMLIDLGQDLAAERDPYHVLEKFCKSAMTIVKARAAAVTLLNVDGSVRYSLSHCLDHDGEERPSAIPQAVLDSLTAESQPIRLTETDELLHTDTIDSDSIRSFLGAPIVSGSGISGWVYLLNKLNGQDFNEADQRLAATLATQVAVAYENALLYSDVQRHATELQMEIAERKQAEEGRAQLLIRERAARAEAEQANRTKDEFLATLSHELRTPLSAILGWSHLVQTGKLDESQMARAFETIERNARTQSQLIDDLLDVSRIITGNLQIEVRPVDLAAVIEATRDSIRPALEAKEIKFEICNQSGASVLGDATRLQQIFWNLFNNAMKFTPPGGEVHVRVSSNSHVAVVEVIDTGIGIRKEFLPFIFDRFRQADGSTTRAHGGLGLGLAIVKHLVQLHEGTISVESAGENQGCSFRVSLPLAQESAKKYGKQSLTSERTINWDPESPRLLEGLRILVVDDEADSRDLIMLILTRCGGEVKCSDSVASAIRQAKKWQPDLVITDIGMPNEDGYNLMNSLKRLTINEASPPAIALTAYATSEDRDRVLEAGFRMHITKPIDPDTLVKSVATISGRPV